MLYIKFKICKHVGGEGDWGPHDPKDVDFFGHDKIRSNDSEIDIWQGNFFSKLKV